MGNCFSDKVQPSDQQKFSRTSSEDSSEYPLKKTRKTTDVFFLILMSLFFIVLIGLLIYCVIYGDIYRVINGYDNCANVCGRQNSNELDEKFACKGIDMKTKRYLMISNAGGHNVDPTFIVRDCVSNCTEHGYRTYLKRCIMKSGSNDLKNVNTYFSKTGLKNFFQEAAEDLDLCSTEIIYLCLIAVVFSIILIFLFRFFVGFVVWFVLFGVVIASIVGTIYTWLLYNSASKKMESKSLEMVSDIDSRNKSSYLALAIIVTIVTLIVILIVIVLRKRIRLVVQLFKEAGRAINSMPILLLEPFVTFLVVGIIITVWIYKCVWIQSSGRLIFVRDEFFKFEKDTIMKTTRWLNLFAVLWIVQFIIGCEYMVIGGSVASWYFTRDKSKLGYPILYALYNLTRYHLGTVALGSLTIAIIQFLRILLGLIQKYFENSRWNCAKMVYKCCTCCLYCFEKILKFINRNAYIEVALYGYSFCRAGKQAFQMLTTNALRVAVINSVGDFVLIMGKVLVVLATTLIAVQILQQKEGIQHMWLPIALIAIFAYFVSHCFLSVYEMAIDTIFLCFCEDCHQNDGVTRPYFMSKGLMQFVEDSRKSIDGIELGKNNGNAWNERKTINTISDKIPN